jgi:hypothetical protein
MENSGRAHVNTIARELSKSYVRDINSIMETITRRINDFCSNAADFKKEKTHDLFERIAPATYRLRAYPEKPNILELIRIEFEDTTLQNMWKEFDEQMRARPEWRSVKNEKKLIAFSRYMSKMQEEYRIRKSFSEEPAS